ncbi:putative aminomethyltransferase mitochondrial precursor [Filobasidium floriforme]|uniref:putative aminomethyltransferase mitochondrial precursor n=1 Tax=Filobasidium floriforme TaxID=5210 RepID=UPI001E8CC5EE|nr:putative aminomethyltransferase mitochondrial precursor [Filobasidium floriforme]KAH8086381.1 putative aminomethyltransferase mitochondrial precursor [Filobasidium floriforme]
MQRSFRADKITNHPILQAELKRTPLFDFHKQNGAKMVPFAGWEMPLSYGTIGQTTAHGHVRTDVGLFDVSHMLQHVFTGASSLEFLSSLCPSSLSSLAPWSSTLSVLLNEEGGIIDDMIVTKHGDDGQGGQRFYVVTNAGRAEEDVAWITKKMQEWNGTEGKGKGREVKWERLEGYGLVALQGPKAAETLQSMIDKDLTSLKFGQATYAKVAGVECHIARGGYTGEDGFEISIPPASAVEITSKLTSSPGVSLIGLGARDSLRLEAGMCLYGHDLDESVSPIEAGLAWLVGKDRRAAGDFPGASRILRELKEGPARRRVGFEITGSPAREGCEILTVDEGSIIGVITSGIPSPTLGKNIAMGYIKNGYHKKGTDVKVKVRKNLRDATVVGMPFVPAKYYR